MQNLISQANPSLNNALKYLLTPLADIILQISKSPLTFRQKSITINIYIYAYFLGGL